MVKSFMKPMTVEWLKAASDDLKVIDSIISRVELSNMVAFHAQQTVEKCFKAFLEEVVNSTPKSHDLIRIFKMVSEHTDLNLDITTLRMINEIYIDARYPGDMGLLPDGKPSLDDARSFADFAVNVYNGISDLLGNTKV